MKRASIVLVFYCPIWQPDGNSIRFDLRLFNITVLLPWRRKIEFHHPLNLPEHSNLCKLYDTSLCKRLQLKQSGSCICKCSDTTIVLVFKRKNQVQFSVHIASVLIHYEDKNRLCKIHVSTQLMRADRRSHSFYHVCCWWWWWRVNTEQSTLKINGIWYRFTRN